MEYETLIACFLIVLFVTTVFRFADRHPTQIYVHACNVDRTRLPSSPSSDSGSDGETEAATVVIADDGNWSEGSEEEESEIEGEKEEEGDDKKTN